MPISFANISYDWSDLKSPFDSGSVSYGFYYTYFNADAPEFVSQTPTSNKVDNADAFFSVTVQNNSSNLDFCNVKTYINSGLVSDENIAFDGNSSYASCSKTVEQTLETTSFVIWNICNDASHCLSFTSYNFTKSTGGSENPGGGGGDNGGGTTGGETGFEIIFPDTNVWEKKFFFNQSTQDYIKIKNTGTATINDFRISATGNASQFVFANIEDNEIAPGQTKDFLVSIFVKPLIFNVDYKNLDALLILTDGKSSKEIQVVLTEGRTIETEGLKEFLLKPIKELFDMPTWVVLVLGIFVLGLLISFIGKKPVPTMFITIIIDVLIIILTFV